MNAKTYIKINNVWYDPLLYSLGAEERKRFEDKEALLLNLDKLSKKCLIQKLRRKKEPLVIIVDGVDGVGKSTIVEKIKRKFEDEGLKVIFNTFKRRRGDDRKFKTPSKRYEWLYRKEIVEQINKRLVTYGDEDVIIVDKSPYSEYFYQRTKSFDRGMITPYGNHKMEKEIFKYKDIVDNAVVIFLENNKCWENYITRETKKSNDGHKASYATLREEEYMDMVKMFKDYQHIYENKNKYKAIEIRNDDKSWKKVYNEILKIVKDNNEQY